LTVTKQIEGKKTGKQENSGIYSNREARKILEYLLEHPSAVFAHNVLPSDDVAYPQAEAVLGDAKVDAAQLLADMTSAGVLSSQLVDKAPACPQCGSKQISTRYLCPQCSTYDIRRTYLYEHLKCGKVGNEESFKKGEQVICPKCQSVLHNFGEEYRVVGVWYECNNCKNSFNNPSHSHFCRPNNHKFSPDLASLIPLFQYQLNRNEIENIRREILVYSEAVAYLENLGLTVLAPHSLKGKSGATHRFDMVLVFPKKGWRGEETTFAVDVLPSSLAVESDVFKNFAAKARDVKPAKACMIAVPMLPSDARSLFEDLKLTAFEGPTIREAMQAFQSKSGISAYIS